MIQFDKAYYDSIWPEQGVHRHDYCEDLTNRLIQKYGKCRILDIGTGCGFLVKTLREKGCDAWGLELSDYAIANSCIPEYIRKGDVKDIPFASGFDVVHSQGLWGYFLEEDIQKAWEECKRVGKIQEHNIDYDPQPSEHQYLFTKSPQWWKNKFYPKVLIGTPIHETKEYSLQRWLNNIKSFTYPNFDVLVVDNSPTEDLMNRWKDKVDIRHINTKGIEQYTEMRKNLSFDLIRKEFLKGDYERMVTIESDIIPSVGIIEFMLKWGKDTDWISVSFPNRENQISHEQGLGCCMFTRRLMEAYDWESLADNYNSDGGFWMRMQGDTRFKTMELWHFVNMIHLKE